MPNHRGLGAQLRFLAGLALVAGLLIWGMLAGMLAGWLGCEIR